MSFQQILDIYRKKSWNERNKGERFEMLMKRFLLSYPLYANELKEVWLWNEFPYRKDFGGNDLGIDLVALTVNDEYWSIQCKFYDEKTNINLDDISHFIANSNRKFLDDKGQSQKFSLCLWIDTKKSFVKNAEQLIKNQHIEFKRLGYYELDNASIDWQALADGETGKSVQLKKKTPREHQRKAIALAHEYFKTKERGKFIMACGTGKTYTALNVVEQETNKNGFILFLVPSIALLSQTLKSWLNDTTGIIYPVCICSDTSSSKVKSKNSDSDEAEYLEEKAWHERAKRQLAELELQKRKNEVHDAADVELVMTDMLTNLRSQLLGLPAKMAPQLANRDKDFIDQALTDEIHARLTELSDYSPGMFTGGSNGTEND